MVSIREMTRSNVKISDPEGVRNKLLIMAADGPESLHVLLDFDKTLSKPTESREPVFSSLEIFGSMDEVPEWYKAEMKKVWSVMDTFLETPNASIEEKIKYCQDNIHHYTDRVKRLQMENVPQLIVRESIKMFKLRENTVKMFNLLKQNSVSTTIISGGIGDVIIAVLQTNGIDVTSIRILANYLKYTNEKLDGFQGHFIDIFNKNQEAMKNASFAKDMEQKRNILVIGDNTADASMADGAPPTSNKLTIGFLNHDVEKNMAAFCKTFDIVIVQDPSMDVVNELLQDIFSQS